MSIKKITPKQYADRKRSLSKVHGFSFLTRKNFTPQQKASITRQWKKYRRSLTDMALGQAVFIPAKRSQKKNLPHLKHSNKGIFLKESNIERARVIGTGQNTRVHISRRHRREIYIEKPFDEDVITFSERMRKEYRPDHIAIAVNGSRGFSAYLPDRWKHYISTLIEDIIERDGQYPNFFTGIYLIWFR